MAEERSERSDRAGPHAVASALQHQSVHLGGVSTGERRAPVVENDAPTNEPVRGAIERRGTRGVRRPGRRDHDLWYPSGAGLTPVSTHRRVHAATVRNRQVVFTT